MEEKGREDTEKPKSTIGVKSTPGDIFFCCFRKDFFLPLFSLTSIAAKANLF